MTATSIVDSLLESEEFEPDKDEVIRSVEPSMKWRAKYPAKFGWVGSVSHGTMNPVDLIRRFLDVLKALDPWVASGEREQIYLEDGTVNTEYYDEFGWVEKLIDFLDSHSPPYTSFGTSEGDGSDYGWWPNTEQLQDDINDGTIVTVNQGEPIDWDSIEEPDERYVAVLDSYGYAAELWDAEFRRKLWEV